RDKNEDIDREDGGKRMDGDIMMMNGEKEARIQSRGEGVGGEEQR
ncbi:recombination-associated protein RdgC, partial [Salmonella enterica subsp. enterica serovar 4,12:i:-]